MILGYFFINFEEILGYIFHNMEYFLGHDFLGIKFFFRIYCKKLTVRFHKVLKETKNREYITNDCMVLRAG